MDKNEELSKLEQVRQSIKKECSLDSLCANLNMSKLEVLGHIAELKNEGNNVLEIKRGGELFLIDYGDNFLLSGNPVKLVKDTNTFKLAFISDTRLCSKYQQLSILNDIYKKASEYGVTDVIHCGDISEGIYSGTKRLYLDTLFIQDAEEQSDYIVNNYPYIEGINTHFIIGDHDITHLTKDKIDIGKLINNKREDMEYIGKNSGVIILYNNNGKIGSIEVLHPTGKIPYTISYKPQRFIDALRSEDKTDILLHGHWLQAEHMYYHNINEFSVPGIVATTPEMLQNGDQNTVGAWFITIEVDKKNKIKKLIPQFIPYYQTIEDDYKKVKTLRIGGINNGTR